MTNTTIQLKPSPSQKHIHTFSLFDVLLLCSLYAYIALQTEPHSIGNVEKANNDGSLHASQHKSLHNETCWFEQLIAFYYSCVMCVGKKETSVSFIYVYRYYILGFRPNDTLHWLWLLLLFFVHDNVSSFRTSIYSTMPYMHSHIAKYTVTLL